MPLGYAFHRQPVPQQSGQTVQHTQLPAPTRGWVTNENLADHKKNSALVLDNFFPEADRVRVRKGAVKSATIGGDPITAMFRYNQGGSDKLFAASETDVYNISSLNPSSAPSADISSQTNGHYSDLQIATSGGEFMYIFNEADAPQLYDGTTWTQITGASSPAITGVTTTLLRHGWVYRDRIFMIERDSLVAWYLPIESVGGAASDVSLQGVFKRGGTLLFGATWSLDAGDGADDKCCFFTDLGEVAVYEGGDPGDPANWNLVGVYDLAEPLGKNAHMRAGGDLVIATTEGLIPLTSVFKNDPGALGIAAVSRAIEPTWRDMVRSRSDTYPWWRIHKWAEKNAAYVTIPHTTSTTPEAYVVNLETGAWCRFTGWDMQAVSLFGTASYFGDASGFVYKMEDGGSDNEVTYTCKMSTAFEKFSAPGSYKTIDQVRAIFTANFEFLPKLSVATNYIVNFPSAPSAVDDSGISSTWDSGIWDTAIWDGGGDTAALAVQTRWKSVGTSGFAHSMQLQITFGNTTAPNISLVAYDVAYMRGLLVV